MNENKRRRRRRKKTFILKLKDEKKFIKKLSLFFSFIVFVHSVTLLLTNYKLAYFASLYILLVGCYYEGAFNGANVESLRMKRNEIEVRAREKKRIS